MKHDSAELDELLAKIDVESYLDREGIEYRRTYGSSGQQLNIKECPVCGNSHWKVYLNADTGQGNCFSGSHPPGKNFSKYWLIRAVKGDATTAQVFDYIKRVAGEMGWRPARKSEHVVVRPDAWELPKSIELPYRGNNLPYLENRGFNGALVAYFHARYAPDGSYYRFKDEHGDWCFQDHSRRVILPVFDLDKKLATFQGRDVTGAAEKKYLFPPQLEGTGVHLYNGFNVKDTKRVIVGEGAFDVWAIKKAVDQDQDLRDIVPIGTFGKHLSHGGGDDQLSKFLKLRERGVEEATFMWDGEIQATDDAIAASRLLKSVGFRVRLAMLPPDRDPNEVAPEVVRAAFYQARQVDAISELQIRMLRRNMNNSMK